MIDGSSPDALEQLNRRYGLEMQPETVPELLVRFGLRLGDPLPGGRTPQRARPHSAAGRGSRPQTALSTRNGP
jgi:hypothetical protein